MRAALPLVIPTALIGASFGVSAATSGWGTVAPIVMSAIVFSGAAQFATLAVLSAGGSVITAIVAATLIASRFLAIGVALGPSMRGGKVRRALEGQAVVDASLILAKTGEARYGVKRLIGSTLPQYLGWTLGHGRGRAGGREHPRPEDARARRAVPGLLPRARVERAQRPRRARDRRRGDADRRRADPDRTARDPGGRRDGGGAGGAGGAAMKRDVWIAVGVLTVICFVIKAAGPVALGGRDLPRWAERLIVLLPAALLSALVVVQTFADGKALVLDARAAGLAAAFVAVLLRANMLDRAARGGADGGGPAGAGLEKLLPVGDPLALVAQPRLQGEERAARAAAVVERLDRLVAGELLAVGGELGRGHARGVGAEEDLQQRGIAQLREPGLGLGAPRLERPPARVRDRELAPPPPALLAPLGDEAGLREPLRLGVERGVGDRPERADAAGDAGLELVRGRVAELEQPQDDHGGGRKIHFGWSMYRVTPTDASPEPTLRASDAEREHHAELLREHAALGRLTVDELDERLDRVYAARTLGELAPVVADLPAPSARERARPPASQRTVRPEVAAYLAVNLMLIVIWAATGAGYFWPIWPLLGWGVGLMGPCARAWPHRRPQAR